MNSKFKLEQDDSETVSLLSCSNSNFEFTRCYFSESVLFYYPEVVNWLWCLVVLIVITPRK